MPKRRLFLYSLIIMSIWYSNAFTEDQAGETIYYAYETNGAVFGYSEINISPMNKEGKEMIMLNHKIYMMMSLLGSEVNTKVKLIYHIDPDTGKFTYHYSDVEQGPAKFDSTIYIEDGLARFTSTQSSDEKKTSLPEDVILENTVYFPHLKRDFVDEGLEKKLYKTYEVREGELQDVTYTREGTEELELSGKTYNAVILSRLNHKTGLKLRGWYDTKTGHVLKSIHPSTGRMTYRADHSVVKKIRVVSVDENIFIRTNKSIADIKSISYMKVKATIEPTGLWITPESLNVPGQKFEGTVKENLIEGVFEIEHKHYDGTNAPAFPPDFSSDESLKEYLESSDLMESEDPVLVEKANQITKGSQNSWEAASRLSEWVAENIAYSIPGGITARNTYDLMSGECGAHSILLAAFCRAVGIPARVIWGCMYTPNHGGAFGQHGWNEVYMGEAGWIPVDSTAYETDYVDSGHVRLGDMQSLSIALGAKEMEIIDYRLGSDQKDESPEATKIEYDKYLGDYVHPAKSEPFKALVQNNSLAVNIPGQMVLELKDPNEEGFWYSKISDRLFFEFQDAPDGSMEMNIHEMIPMPRRSDPDTIDESVPETHRPYLGKYLLAAMQAEFTVIYKDGSLAVINPLENRTVGFQKPDEKGRWLDEFNKNTISFKSDDKGNITTMVIDSVSKFIRKK